MARITHRFTPIDRSLSSEEIGAQIGALFTDLNLGVPEFNALADEVEGFADAILPAYLAFLSGCNASVWVSGRAYTLGETVWPPGDLSKVYRRKVAGGGIMSPDLDPTNWQFVGSFHNAVFTGNSLTLPNGPTSGRPSVPKLGDTRQNTTTNKWEFYTGSAWRNLSIEGPAFSVAAAPPYQTISPNTWTKITFSAVDFDTNSCYDALINFRFTPSIQGYYQVSLQQIIASGSSTNYCTGAVYKNGALYKSVEGQSVAGNYSEESLSFPMYFNGTTDYMEAYSYIETNYGYIYPMSCFSAIFIRGIE